MTIADSDWVDLSIGGDPTAESVSPSPAHRRWNAQQGQSYPAPHSNEYASELSCVQYGAYADSRDMARRRRPGAVLDHTTDSAGYGCRDTRVSRRTTS